MSNKSKQWIIEKKNLLKILHLLVAGYLVFTQIAQGKFVNSHLTKAHTIPILFWVGLLENSMHIRLQDGIKSLIKNNCAALWEMAKPATYYKIGILSAALICNGPNFLRPTILTSCHKHAF